MCRDDMWIDANTSIFTTKTSTTMVTPTIPGTTMSTTVGTTTLPSTITVTTDATPTSLTTPPMDVTTCKPSTLR